MQTRVTTVHSSPWPHKPLPPYDLTSQYHCMGKQLESEILTCCICGHRLASGMMQRLFSRCDDSRSLPWLGACVPEGCLIPPSPPAPLALPAPPAARSLLVAMAAGGCPRCGLLVDPLASSLPLAERTAENGLKWGRMWVQLLPPALHCIASACAHCTYKILHSTQ